MRVTYLTGQEPASVDLGPVILPGGGGAATLPVGAEGQLLGYGPNGVPVAVDAPDGSTYDDTAILSRVAAVESAIADIPAPYDDTALSGRLDAVEADLADIPAAYDDTALAGRVTALEEAPAPSWADVTGKPTMFAPSAHTHSWDEVTGKPTTFAPSAHGHSIAEVSGLQTALDGKLPTTTFKTVNSQTITGSGNIVTAQSFATDAEALAYSTANPGVIAFSRQV